MTFKDTMQIELDKIPAHKRPTKKKKALLGAVMIAGAITFKLLGWWDLVQIPMFVLGGHLVAGDYVNIAVRSAAASLKEWKGNGK